MDRGETKQSLVSPLFLSTENLTKFETEESVQQASNFPHVTSVEETEKIDYSFVLKEDNFVAGDIVLWDGEKKVVADPNGFSLPARGYTPIGIVVIPASHMDDGQARIMSTRWMSYDDPENGSLTYKAMVWGTATDLTGLTNYTEVPIIARYDDEGQGGTVPLTEPQEIYTTYRYCYFSSDYPTYTGETNPEDNGTRWFQNGSYYSDSGHTVLNGYNYYAPSPYASDGTPNPLYRATSYSGGSINNVLSYFDGRQQTNAILTARGEKDYESWKPNSETPEDYPAASCCDMYHTVGTSQGDWYLPSIAELGYIVPRLNRISTAMSKVNGLHSLPNAYVWSSTEYTENNAFDVRFGRGAISCYRIKDTFIRSVIAFTSL